MCTAQRALLSHHWVHSGRTHSLSRPGGLPTRARPECTNGHSTDLYTPRQPTPTSIRCRPDHPAAPATSWRRSAWLEAPGAPKIAEPATSSGQQPDRASDPPPRRPEMVSPTPEAWRTAGGGQPSHPAPPSRPLRAQARRREWRRDVDDFGLRDRGEERCEGAMCLDDGLSIKDRGAQSRET